MPSGSIPMDGSSIRLHEPLLARLRDEEIGENACDEQDHYRGPSPLITPYQQAGLFSQATFSWLGPLIGKGSKQPIRLPDVPHLAEPQRVEAKWMEFDRHFTAQATNRKKPSIVRALCASFWLPFIGTGFLVAANSAVLYVGPLVLRRFVEFAGGKQRFGGEGYVLVLTLLAAKLVETASRQQFNFQISVLSMNASAALSAAVYRKGIKLSQGALAKHTVGEMSNYITVDTTRIGDMARQLHGLWSVPLQIVLAVIILFQVVGYAMLAGLATMAAMLGATYLLANWQRLSNREFMAHKDRRMKATSECLRNMRSIKLQAWEGVFQQQLEDLRGREFPWVAKYVYLGAAQMVLGWLGPALVGVLTFGMCLLLGVPLTPSRTFTTIATFRVLKEPLRNLPQVITALTQAMVSLDRLGSFLWSPEIQSGATTGSLISASTETKPVGEKFHPVNHLLSQESSLAVNIVGATFTAGSAYEEKPVLQGIHLKIRKGQIVAVCGAAGSGKSSLLACISRELTTLSGQLSVAGPAAYAPQAPWVLDATIRENILLGQSLNPEKYAEVLSACALKQDVECMPLGDRTEVGEGGRALSGGQKQRIQLARALYQDAAICLLDDPFQALDAHTASHLVQTCLERAKQERTFIVTTTQPAFLQAADIILLMKDGKIVQSGKYDDLLHEGQAFQSLIRFPQQQHGAEGSRDSAQLEALPGPPSTSNVELPSQRGDIGLTPYLPLSTPAIATETPGNESMAGAPSDEVMVKQRLMAPEEEGRATGSVSKDVYWEYATKVYRGLHFPLFLVILIIWQMLQLASDWWLASATSPSSNASLTLVSRVSSLPQGTADSLHPINWDSFPGFWHSSVSGPGGILKAAERTLLQTGQGFLSGVSENLQLPNISATAGHAGSLSSRFSPFPTIFSATQSSEGVRVWAGYAGFACLSGLFVFFRSFLAIGTGLATAQEFFRGMLRSVMHAPLSFFSATSSGQIINRMLRDQNYLDLEIPFCVLLVGNLSISLLGTLVVPTAVTWQALFVIVPLGAVFIRLQRVYLATSRELTRLEAVTRSPIIHHLTESVAGAAILRSAGQADAFARRNMDQINDMMRTSFHNFAAMQWLAVRLECMSTAVLCFAALMFTILPSGTISPGLVGLSLFYGLSLNHTVYSLVMVISTLENEMVAVERVRQYSHIASEAADEGPESPVGLDWPPHGALEVINLKVKYHPHLPLVLAGVSFAARPGEKVGIVGRTGVGKTTLIQALFRLLEPTEGCILIDGWDIRSIKRHDLRSRLGIVPQEPAIFEGTIRDNLDPLREHTDVQIWEVLEMCQLTPAVSAEAQKLNAPVLDQWSASQRQLLCLARALLRRPKLLALDEATVSVDLSTDALIQRTIRNVDCTVLNVAHRVSSIFGCDRVLVLVSGVVAEYDTPRRLLEDSSSVFSSLARHSSTS